MEYLMTQKLLTVIVTSYNYEQFIGNTLDCLTNQTNQDFDIIVIDDGSKDNSKNIIKDYAKKHTNIQFLEHPGGVNKGLCETTKLALSKVKTPYTAFCESDDYWETTHVERLLNFIKSQPDANLIFNKIIVKNFSSNPEYDAYVDFSNNKLSEVSNTNIFDKLVSNYMPTFSSACIKTSELKQCDFSSIVPQYLDFWLWRQLCVNNKVHYVDDCITYWRKHDESYDMKENVQNIDFFIIASNNLILNKLKKKVPFLQYIKIKTKRLFYKNKKYISYQIKQILKYK